MNRRSQLAMRRSLDELPPLEVAEGLRVERYRDGDDRAWLDLLNRNDELRQPDAAGTPQPWTVPPWRRPEQAIPLESVHFVRSGSKTLATACAIEHATAPRWELGWVAADPSALGKGLGRLVALATLHFMRDELGADEAFLLTDDERLPAIRTYLRLGFVPEPRSDDEAGRWDAVLEQMRGGAHADRP
jgi:mycothiol synthase